MGFAMRFGQRLPEKRPSRERHTILPMRVGLLMLLLAAVLVAMQQARNPNTWRWLFGPGQAAPQAEKIDTRLDAPPQPPPARQGVVRIAKAQAVPSAAEEQQQGFFPGVRPELLAKVRDNTIWRGEEHEAFFHLLRLLKQTPEQQLWPRARRNVSFVQLFRQPEVYRGHLVYLRGRARRAVWEQAPENQFGIQRYAFLVLQLDDHPMDPTLVYALELPEGFPTGPRIDEPVELVGFFYKRKAYLAQDTVRTAPLVLAKTLRWQPPEPVQAVDQTAGRTLLLWVGAAAVVALVVVVLLWKSQPPGARPPVELSPEEHRRVEEQLEQLAQEPQSPSEPPDTQGDLPT